MAVTFVPCLNKRHAVECRKANLLYIDFCFGRGMEICGPGLSAQWVEEAYGDKVWPPKDFAYAVED